MEPENLPSPNIVATDLDHRTLHKVRQALIFGASLYDVCEELQLPMDLVAGVAREVLGQRLTPSARKAIALARIDELSAMLLARGADGDLDAINTWIKLQKREATLAGLDEPERQERRVVVDAPWLTARRLEYKEGMELAEDIEARQLPPPSAESE